MKNEYEAALDWLNELASEKKFFRDKQAPSLTVINQILDLLGRPDETFSHRVIIGGTAGKGTTARYVEQTLLMAGKSTALLASPHLQVVNERIRLNGQLVSREDFAQGVLFLQKICKTAQIEPTYYEAIVLAGIYLAAQKNIEILICEVGIGGEFDAVNAVRGPRLAAVTFIGDDHLELFGGKMENIAVAKAGIFTKESLANFTFEQKYRSIFEKISNSEIQYIKGIRLKMNKKIARKMCEQILGSNDFRMTPPKLPARWEKIDHNLILDGAHSLPRFEYILPKIQKIKRPIIALFTSTENHNLDIFVPVMDQISTVIWTSIDTQRDPRNPNDLQSFYERGIVDPNWETALGLALEKARAVDGVVLVNSFFLCGAVREKFYPGALMLDQQTEWPERIFTFF